VAAILWKTVTAQLRHTPVRHPNVFFFHRHRKLFCVVCAHAKAVLITPFFFDVSNVRSYKLSPAVVPFVKEKTKTEQDETGGVAVRTNNVASKKTEISNAERTVKHFRAKRSEVASKKTEIGNVALTVKILKDEIKSLDGEQRAAIILEANLKREEAKRIIEQADMMLPQLEATIADNYAQLQRLMGSTAID